MVQHEKMSQPKAKSTTLTRRAMATGLAIAFGAAAVAVTLGQTSAPPKPAPTGEGSLVTLLRPEQLDEALQSVAPEQREAVKEEVKSCKRLAFVMQIGKIPAAVGKSSGMIQIRSGSFLTPWYKVGDFPISVLVLAPELVPITTGKIEILGSAENARVELDPPSDFTNLKGSQMVDIYWYPTEQCEPTQG